LKVGENEDKVRGLFALRNIETNEEILSVPNRLMITPHHIKT